MNYYNNIKKELTNNEVYKKVKDYSKNRSDLNTYYNVGKLLSEAGKHYGEGIIKEYSKKLTKELNIKYDFSSLNKMKKFYLLIVATLSPNLSYSHYVELLPIDDINKINYYIKTTEEQNLSVRQLRNKIKNNEYERLDNKTKNKLIKKEENKVEDFIKNPILIKNSYNYKEISEKILKQLILEDIPSFLEELGEGFSYIKSEYKIKIGDRYNYIDLLLFNYIYNCFIVVELKITELKKEHIGQIQTYINYIDKNVKRIEQDKTIGIIISRKDNHFIMEYCSDKRILSKEYQLI
jgi:predicted nuclease of restriction endonuclease-like (RecB) superfamily